METTIENKKRLTYHQLKQKASDAILDRLDEINNKDTSYGELVEFYNIVSKLAKKYGLFTNLKNNGIL